jgi:hypothetical protein
MYLNFTLERVGIIYILLTQSFIYYNMLKSFYNKDIRVVFKVVVWSRDSSVGIATGYGLDDQGERELESR